MHILIFPSKIWAKKVHYTWQNDSVSVLLVCLVCFLDSIVYRHAYFAILLFMVLVFLFVLNESL